MRQNKAICENYLKLINERCGCNLKLSKRYGYYVIENELESTATETILTGATLAQCKDWAVSVYSFTYIIKEG